MGELMRTCGLVYLALVTLALHTHPVWRNLVLMLFQWTPILRA